MKIRIFRTNANPGYVIIECDNREMSILRRDDETERETIERSLAEETARFEETKARYERRKKTLRDALAYLG